MMCDEHPKLCCEAINDAICKYNQKVAEAVYNVNSDMLDLDRVDAFNAAILLQQTEVCNAFTELMERSKKCKLPCCDSAAESIACVGGEYALQAATITLNTTITPVDPVLNDHLAALLVQLKVWIAKILATVECPKPPCPHPEPKKCFKFLRCKPPHKKESCFKCKPCRKPCNHCEPEPKPCHPKPCHPKPYPPKPCPPKPCPPKPYHPKPCDKHHDKPGKCDCKSDSKSHSSHSSHSSYSSHSSRSSNSSSSSSHSYRMGRFENFW